MRDGHLNSSQQRQDLTYSREIRPSLSTSKSCTSFAAATPHFLSCTKRAPTVSRVFEKETVLICLQMGERTGPSKRCSFASTCANKCGQQ